MKIVDVAEFYSEQGGGVRTYVNQKLAAAEGSGHEVVVIAPGPADRDEVRGGGRIRWVKGPPLPADGRYHVLWNERRVHALLDEEAPDVVEGSSPWTGGWFAARWRGPHAARARRAFVFHMDPVAAIAQTHLSGPVAPDTVDRLCTPVWAMLRRLARRYDVTVTASEWLAQRCRGFGIANAEAVPFGIDKDRFGPAARDTATRAALLERCGIHADVRDDAFLWIATSRLDPEKRIPTVLGAFDRLRRATARPVGLVVFGHGPQRARCDRIADAIPGAVLAGYETDRDAMARSLASADGFVHGSAAETFGLGVAEAVCAGVPVVVPDRGGAADLCDDAFGARYTTGDAAAASSAMADVMRRDRAALAPALATAATERIVTVDEHFRALWRRYGSL